MAGTGQDQVAAIKRQLCLFVPGIRVFLEYRCNDANPSLAHSH
jgi:hypothetical protein